MQPHELRQMIRDAIAAELGPDAGRRQLAREPRDEIVSIGSDEELAQFVRRLLDMADDLRTREDIRAGRLRFRLAAGVGQRSEVQQAPHVERGVVSEKQVDALSEGTQVLRVGKGVRLTPLARDRLRARKIKIERVEP
jgi:hypothetical protein